MKGRIERTVFNLQNIVRSMFDYVGDGVTMRGSPGQRLKNEQIESALEHCPRAMALGEGRTVVNILP